MDIGAQCFQQLVLDGEVAAAFQHRRRSGRRCEADRIELSSGDRGDQLVEVAAQRCRLPPVDPDGHDFGARGTQSAQNSGNGSQASAAPCSWMAMRLPDTPDSRRYFSTSCEDSDFGDHSSCRPAARSAPVAFGPRATIRADDNAAISWLDSPHPSAAATQPRKPIPVCATKISGGSAINALVLLVQFVIVGQRDHVDRWGAADLGAIAAQQRAQLLGAARRSHRNAVAGQGAESGWVIVTCVCLLDFRCITPQLLTHCPPLPRRSHAGESSGSSTATPAGRRPRAGRRTYIIQVRIAETT